MQDAQRVRLFGISGVMFGATALVLALTMTLAGPFGPQEPVGQTIGEIAGDIIKSTWREVRGIPQPPPEPQGMDINLVLTVAATVLGAAALVAGLISLLRREARVLGKGAMWLGASTLAFQVFSWVVLIIAAVVLLVEIIRNIGAFGESVSSIFDGGLFSWLPFFGE